MVYHSFTFRCFHYVVATTWVWQNSVTSASFLIILHLILMCLHVIWRAQCSERPTMCHSFTFWVFHYIVPTPCVAELGEFCFVSYHNALDSNVFTCRLKGPVQQEACDVPFFCISSFSLCSHPGYKAELGEFCFVFYHLILNSNIFTCNLKGLVRWEAYDVPFFHILMFSLCSGYNLGVAELHEFCFISYHLILHSNLYVCCLMPPWDERHRLHCSITFQGFFYHPLFLPCLFAL